MIQRIILLLGISLLSTTITLAQYAQRIPDGFSERMISENKVWRAISYDKVQVSGSSKPLNKGYVIVRRDEIEIVDQNGNKRILPYVIIPGAVDPRLKTSDGKIYEVRFFNKPPIERMRLTCVESPDKLSYFESITYTH